MIQCGPAAGCPDYMNPTFREDASAILMCLADNDSRAGGEAGDDEADVEAKHSRFDASTDPNC